MFTINGITDYTKEIRELVKDNNKYYIYTYGCKLNENDSEKIAGILEKCGFESTTNIENAKIIVFNTCCIRENAENTLFGNLGEVKKYAKNGAKILVGGCMMQEEKATKKIKESYPFVSVIFGTHTIQNLPKDIYLSFKEEKKIYDVLDIDGKIYEGIPVKRLDKKRASVTITYGCNNFCTYCIVPYVRGRERSRKAKDIIEEVRDLVKEGYIEVTLLGQNVNSYIDKDENINFAKLLDMVASIDGLKKIRFISPHPKDFTEDVIYVMKKHKNISRTIHYPLQSGSNNILKKMNRKYTKEDYLNRAKKIMEILPDVKFSTDIIVGFPEETDEDFNETMDVVRKMNFEQIFMFIYSKREGTVAYNRTQVPEVDKKRRFEILKKEYEDMQKDIMEKYVGTEENVIIDGISKNNESMLSARTDSNKQIILPKYDGYMIGDYVKVKILSNHKWFLEGEKI